MSKHSQRLKGKVTVITGAGEGIGQAISRLFARHGAILVLTDICRSQLEKLRESAHKGDDEIFIALFPILKKIGKRTMKNMRGGKEEWQCQSMLQ